MGCTGSKLKGDDVPDLTSTPPRPSKPETSLAPQQTTITTSDLPEKQPTTDSQTTYPHSLPQQPAQNNKEPSSSITQTPPEGPNKPPTLDTHNRPRKQSLAQRWKERKGVPEPKDENGRGLYSGMTTEDLIKLSRSQIVDGRVCAAG